MFYAPIPLLVSYNAPICADVVSSFATPLEDVPLPSFCSQRVSVSQFGLSRNPFTDRTAEKTVLDSTSLYVHSDLQGFSPSGARDHVTASLFDPFHRWPSECSYCTHTVP